MTQGQERAPFFDAMCAYHQDGIVPYSTPGHKQGRGAAAELINAFGHRALEFDIPHGGGADDTHRTRGLLSEAEGLAAAAWGADATAFLVNGSSTGNIAFLLATCQPGDTVILARNLHKSLLAGLVLSGANPVYLYPAIDPATNLSLDISSESVATALKDHPDARAVILVSPAYTGVSSDLLTIADHCNAAQVPLLIDEAWGPHFSFHPELPPSAMQAGAAAGVTSIHKLLGGLTQSSLVTMRSGMIDVNAVRSAISLIETTSPMAMIYASIDVARRQMALQGHELLTQTLSLAMQARERLSDLPGLHVIGPEVIDARPGARFDPTRILIDVRNLGISGFTAEAFLRDQARIGVEMSDLLGVIVHVTIADSQQTIDHLVHGLTFLIEQASTLSPLLQETGFLRSSGAVVLGTELAMSPRQATTAQQQTCPIEDAIGAISAEMITPYPPGIPVIAPGEVITADVIEYLRAGMASGMYLSGPVDPGLTTIRIVST